MPIKRENMKLYPGGSIHSKEWKAIRAKILERAVNRCEECRALHLETIARGHAGDEGTYMVVNGDTFDEDTGKFLGVSRGSEYCFNRMVKVVLTIAHLDHDPTNNDHANLKALCQLHHNRLDAAHRASSRRLASNLDLFV